MLWWHEAGLHSVTSAVPFRWRDAGKPSVAPDAPPADLNSESKQAPTPSDRQPMSAPPAAPALRLVTPASASATPNDMAAFRAWLESDAAQPEASWHGPICLPSATVGAKLLVLIDMPGEAFDVPALPLDPAQARFMGAMLSSIGLTLADVAFAPLAYRRPPGGLIDYETAATLGRRMRHYLSLTRPKAALILGDRTNRAVNATQGAASPGHLSEINIESGILKVAALASPEHLMRRPIAKANSWRTLCLLQGVVAA